jgi:hypothetical protein
METVKKTTEKVTEKVTPVVKKDETPKKTRKPRAKTRALAELENVPYTKMTQKELILCINDLKKEVALADNKLVMLENNLKSAYEAKRNTEDAYHTLLRQVGDDIEYIQRLTATFTESMLRVTQKGQ